MQGSGRHVGEAATGTPLVPTVERRDVHHRQIGGDGADGRQMQHAGTEHAPGPDFQPRIVDQQGNAAAGNVQRTQPRGHTDLVPNLQYEARVTARNHAAIDPNQLASSDPSLVSQFTTNVGAPVINAITLSVSGLSPYTSNARFSWTVPAPNGGASTILSYTVRYRAHGASEWIENNVGNQLAYTVPAALTPGQRYDVEIVATTATGDGPAATSTFVARAIPADAPTGLNVGATTAGGAHLQWTPPVNDGDRKSTRLNSSHT